jgi:hypothetical protein
MMRIPPDGPLAVEGTFVISRRRNWKNLEGFREKVPGPKYKQCLRVSAISNSKWGKLLWFEEYQGGYLANDFRIAQEVTFVVKELTK